LSQSQPPPQPGADASSGFPPTSRKIRQTHITHFTETKESALKRKIEDQKLYEQGIDPKILKEVRTAVSVQSITLGESGEEKINDATVNYALGFVTGILIYIFIFVLG
jgi:hypothetical protein